jgi:hypothetical protein
LNQTLKGGHGGLQLGALATYLWIHSVVRKRQGFGAAFLQREFCVVRSQLTNELLDALNLLQRRRNLHLRLSHTHGAALNVLQQPTLECPAAIRAMGVNTASRSLQCAAGLQEQLAIIFVLLDLQSHDFEGGGFIATGQFDIGEQRAVATEAALGAKQVCEARFHSDVPIRSAVQAATAQMASQLSPQAAGRELARSGDPFTSWL